MIDQPTYPNRLARFLLQAAQEILGKHGLQAVLALADLERYQDQPPPDTLERGMTFAQIAALNRALEEMYGIRGGRGMTQRIGRAWLGCGLMQFGALKGIHDPAFHVLAREERIHLSLLALADVFSRFSDQQCTVSVRADQFVFSVSPCAMCWGRSAERPVCTAMLGLLQELVRWASNGYDYPIQETGCQAAGAPACVFVIQKNA